MKTVKTGGALCPDCRLEKRRRAIRLRVDAKNERADRLARIAQASPPSSTVDGQLQRWKDDQAMARVEDPHAVDDGEEDDHMDALEIEPTTDDELDEVLEPPPSRGRPAHRQAPPSSDTRGGSWWTQVKPGEMTKTATTELARMANTKEGKRQHRQLGSEIE